MVRVCCPTYCNAEAPPPNMSPVALGTELTRSSAATAAARSTLKQILSAPEFAAATRAPTAWHNWRAELSQWLARQLEDLFRAAAQHPTTSQLIFWGVAVAALAFVALQLFRLWNHNSLPGRSVPAQAGAGMEYDAAHWLSAARVAAAQGDFAQAIQCTYWSGVTLLQAGQALPHDAVHTPRELLSSLDRGSAVYEPLRSLTNAVENCWYAQRPADAADWDLCRQSLEALEWKQD